MADTAILKSKTPPFVDEYTNYGDDENGATKNTTGPISTPADDRSPQTGDFLLVVVGKSGTGKSSLCNLIKGAKAAFHVSSGLCACTVKTEEKLVKRYGLKFSVMDTPGCEEDSDMAQLVRGLKERLASFCNRVFFLFCVRCDARYAAEEHGIFLTLKAAWRNDLDLKNRLFLAFTHGDSLSGNADKGENLPTDEVKGDNKAYYDSDDAQGHDDPGRVPSEQGSDATKGRAARERLQTMLHVTWPQLTELVEMNAREYFLFSNKDNSGINDVRKLLDYLREYTPPKLAVTEYPTPVHGDGCWHKQFCRMMSYPLATAFLLVFALLLLALIYFVWDLIQFLH